MTPATVYFADGVEAGETEEVERLLFKDSGWVGLVSEKGGEIVYYPPRQIDRIVRHR